ncbi:uncharacterized protein METZ01_LOCUS251162 [marine metagenome]|uniref:Uncharacterized protein n=1 Tax=marine metagenome TaxID=408172 RepID=A0A382IFG8_9ZZZZ
MSLYKIMGPTKGNGWYTLVFLDAIER